MTIEDRVLEVGTVGTLSAGDLYTVPSGKAVWVTSLQLANTGTSTPVVNAYVKKSGDTTPYNIGEPSKALTAAGSSGCAAQMLGSPQELRLAAGDKICADSDTASDVKYLINGVMLG